MLNGIEVGIDDRVPIFRGHAVEHGVAGDAGIVHQNLNWTEIGLNLFYAGGAGLEDDTSLVTGCRSQP
jgi:hypothetical protein